MNHAKAKEIMLEFDRAESKIRHDSAMRVLNAGLDIFDKWFTHKHLPFKRKALFSKALCIIQHDRFLINDRRL